MQRNIIPDASCLIVLEKIDCLEVLRDLYDTILITSKVVEEFGSPIPELIRVQAVENTQYPMLIEATVDSGEASAIALALEQGGLLILDDTKARKLAGQYKLAYTGTFGILLEAKRCGVITSFRSILDRIKQTNFYVSEPLEKRLLELAEE